MMSHNYTVHRLVTSESSIHQRWGIPMEVQFWIRKDTPDTIDDGHMVILHKGEIVTDPWVITRQLPHDKQQSNSYISHEPLSLTEMRWAWETLTSDNKDPNRPDWIYVAMGDRNAAVATA